MRPPILVLLPSLRQDDWPAWRFLLSDDIPEQFEVWQHAAGAIEKEAIGRGQALKWVEIDPMKFAAWCVQTDTDPSQQSLERFASHTGALQRFM